MNKSTYTLPIVTIDTWLVISSVVGIATGVVFSFFVSSDLLASVSSASGAIEIARNGGWFGLFLRYFVLNFAWLLLSFLFGFGPVFQPLCFILVMLKAAVLGLFTRAVYSAPDALQSLVVFIPGGIASFAVIARQTKHAIDLSNMYLSITVTNENRLGLKNQAGEYSARFLAFSLTLAIISALRCLTICLLAR